MDGKVQLAEGKGVVAKLQKQLELLTLHPEELQNLTKLKSGGFGDIYRGRSPRLGKEVAVKIIRGSGEFSKQLMREARMMQKARHPNVLQLLGLYKKVEGEYEQFGLIVEYMAIGSLYCLFQKMNPESVPWPLRFQVLYQVALGMCYLHHELRPPLLHLDLKPKNVLLDGSLTVQLTDFGLSRIRDATTSSGTVSGGTLAYMPPEALKSIHNKPQEPFDVYSYGILIWSVLAAQEPYAGACSEQFKLLIPEGQRPDEKILDDLGDIKMLPEARNLMVACWSGVPADRPSFQECVLKTQEIFAVYEPKIDDAVCTVLDRLKKSSAKGSEMKASSVGAQDEAQGSSKGSGLSFLLKHQVAIVQQLTTIEPILKSLLQEKVINEGEYRVITSEADLAAQIRKTLSMIKRKGEMSSTRFYQLLAEKEPHLVQSLQGQTD